MQVFGKLAPPENMKSLPTCRERQRICGRLQDKMPGKRCKMHLLTVEAVGSCRCFGAACCCRLEAAGGGLHGRGRRHAAVQQAVRQAGRRHERLPRQRQLGRREGQTHSGSGRHQGSWQSQHGCRWQAGQAPVRRCGVTTYVWSISQSGRVRGEQQAGHDADAAAQQRMCHRPERRGFSWALEG